MWRVRPGKMDLADVVYMICWFGCCFSAAVTFLVGLAKVIDIAPNGTFWALGVAVFYVAIYQIFRGSRP